MVSSHSGLTIIERFLLPKTLHLLNNGVYCAVVGDHQFVKVGKNVSPKKACFEAQVRSIVVVKYTAHIMF